MRALALILALTYPAAAGMKHFFPRPVFQYAHHPDLPIEAFGNGSQGIPLPSHARIYLFAVYRAMDARPLGPAERRDWLAVWNSRKLGGESYRPPTTGYHAWRKLREGIPVPGPAVLTPAKNFARDAFYRGWSRCPDDLYETAAATLRDRIKRFGLASGQLRWFVEGQDLAIEACREQGFREPPPLPPEADPIIRADRAYHRAAMLFHAARFDEAVTAFTAIAADSSSPWRTWAPYLIGRCYLEHARFSSRIEEYPALVARAATQFRAVLADPSLRSTHAAAEYLYVRCLLAIRPEEAIARLGNRLIRPASGQPRERDLYLYLSGLDFLPDTPFSPSDPLTLWIHTFQDQSQSAIRRSVRAWKTTRSAPWLLAAASKVAASDAAASEVLDASLAYPIESPGGDALHYHAARLLSLRGDLHAARRELDVLAARLHNQPSALNRVIALKMQCAGSLDEFAALAPRRVILATDELDSSEFAPSEDPKDRLLASQTWFDEAAATIITQRLPLRLLESLTSDGKLPPNLRDPLRLALWTRAALTSDSRAVRFAPWVEAMVPAAKADLDRYTREPSPFTLALALLRIPGARPHATAGYGRLLPPGQHDEWMRNWWYAFNREEMFDNDFTHRLHPSPDPILPRLGFLTEADEQEAAAEWMSLRKAPQGLDWMAASVLAEMRRRPADRQWPGLLYRLMRASSGIFWASPPESALKLSAVAAVERMLKTRYASTYWGRRYESEPRYR